MCTDCRLAFLDDNLDSIDRQLQDCGSYTICASNEEFVSVETSCPAHPLATAHFVYADQIQHFFPGFQDCALTNGGAQHWLVSSCCYFRYIVVEVCICPCGSRSKNIIVSLLREQLDGKPYILKFCTHISTMHTTDRLRSQWAL